MPLGIRSAEALGPTDQLAMVDLILPRVTRENLQL